jgi:hypothetical protein
MNLLVGEFTDLRFNNVIFCNPYDLVFIYLTSITDDHFRHLRGHHNRPIRCFGLPISQIRRIKSLRSRTSERFRMFHKRSTYQPHPTALSKPTAPPVWSNTPLILTVSTLMSRKSKDQDTRPCLRDQPCTRHTKCVYMTAIVVSSNFHT